MPKKKSEVAEKKASVEETQVVVEEKEKVAKREKPSEETQVVVEEKEKVPKREKPSEETQATVKEKEKVPKEEKPVEEVSEKEEVSPKVSKVLEVVNSMSPEERTEFCVSLIKGLSVLELSEWVKTLEKEFGISAAAPLAVAAGSQEPLAPAEEEKKDSFTVMLMSSGDKKIQVIKEVRTITHLGLREAKALVDEAPKPVKENVTEQEANEIKAKLEAAGAGVELK